MHTKIQSLLQQEMSRKDFLIRLVGMALLVTGVTGIIKRMTSFQFQTKGYGSSQYGGIRKGL